MPPKNQRRPMGNVHRDGVEADPRLVEGVPVVACVVMQADGDACIGIDEHDRVAGVFSTEVRERRRQPLQSQDAL
ncbi:MAG TPA: hypothetical protein VLK57_09190, partial [Pseudonocardia sp.]|nr:hypothetical protein [Pseudonocardia sp.]